MLVNVRSNQSAKRKFTIRNTNKNRISPAKNLIDITTDKITISTTTTTTSTAEVTGEVTTATTANMMISPTTTLFRKEAYAPLNTSHLNRSISHRSYNTLRSNSANKKPTTQANQILMGAALEQRNNINLPNLSAVKGAELIRPLRNRPPSRLHMVQNKCSQATLYAKSFASIRPATANSTSRLKSTAYTKNSLNTTSPKGSTEINGICRITRHPKEQELVPDRINYDKRGLTMIPIFENEPNLRMLSLQHNLINTFHIPKETLPTDNHKNLPKNETNTPANKVNDKNSLRCQNLGQQAPKETIPTLIITIPCNELNPQMQLHKKCKLSQNYTKMKSVNKYQTRAKSMLPNHIRLSLSKSKNLLNKFTNLTLNNSSTAAKKTPNTTTNKKTNSTKDMNGKSFDSSISCLTTDSASIRISSEFDGESSASYGANNLQFTYSSPFKHLVFLDLYDNQIECIGNLDGLPALNVLLLGKNRISDISGLASLRSTLCVLDLHDNKITNISNKINSLHELKSLNLASNQLRQINQNDFNGLNNLKELNLKRNRLKRINGFQYLPALERLWLCHNDLHKVDDMASIVKANNLTELTIENNPVSLAGDCVSFLVSYLPNLQTLSQMQITDKVRIAAMTWRTNKLLTTANGKHLTGENYNNLRREEIISNARTNWELLRSQQQLKSNNDNNDKRNHQFITDDKSVMKLPIIDVEANNHSQKTYNENIIDKINQQNKSVNGESRLLSSNSSLGPNINSSSTTCYSSPDDEHLPPTTNRKVKGKCMQQPSNRVMQKKCDNSLKQGSSTSSLLRNNGIKPTNITLINNQQQQQQQLQTKLTGKKGNKLAATNASAKLVDLNRNGRTAHNIYLPFATTSKTITTTTAATTVTANTMKMNATPTPATVVADSASSANVNASTTSKSNDNNIIASQVTLQMQGYKNTTTNNNNNNSSSCSSSSRKNPNLSSTTTATTVNNNLINSQTMDDDSKCNSDSKATECTLDLLQMQATISSKEIMTPANTAITNSTWSNNQPYTRQQRTLQLEKHKYTGIQSEIQRPLANIFITNSKQSKDCGTNITCSDNKAEQYEEGNRGDAVQANGTEAICKAVKNMPTVTVNQEPKKREHQHEILQEQQKQQDETERERERKSKQEKESERDRERVRERERERHREKDRIKEREQGGDYLIEICGRYLNIYGQGAIRFIDKQWNPNKANDVHTLNFSYVNFNNIIAVFARIKSRFPNAENYVFRETNITYLGQLNALAELQGINSLFIDPEGNAITTKDLWRHYAIYRLSHWGLKLLNQSEVTASEIDEADRIFSGLSDLIMWSIPESMLAPLLQRLNLDESCSASKLSPKEWLMRDENKSLRSVVGKEALQWNKISQQELEYLSNMQLLQQDNTAGNKSNKTLASLSSSALTAGILTNQSAFTDTTTTNVNSMNNNHIYVTSFIAASPMSLSLRERGRIHISQLMQNTCDAIEKLHKLDLIWPSMLTDIIRNALIDYSQLDVYVQNVMNEIMK